MSIVTTTAIASKAVTPIAIKMGICINPLAAAGIIGGAIILKALSNPGTETQQSNKKFKKKFHKQSEAAKPEAKVENSTKAPDAKETPTADNKTT